MVLFECQGLFIWLNDLGGNINDVNTSNLMLRDYQPHVTINDEVFLVENWLADVEEKAYDEKKRKICQIKLSSKDFRESCCHVYPLLTLAL